MSGIEHPEQPQVRTFTVDDALLWESRPHVALSDLAIEGVSDEEWDAFFAALAEK